MRSEIKFKRSSNARGMIFLSLEMANLENMLHEGRLGLPIPPMPAHAEQAAAADVQIEAARAEYVE